jgi:peptide chain release factor 3
MSTENAITDIASERQLEREIGKRRTFAIISHPDAGKTTLTEKLLLYGGAIRLAGSVKARRAARHATSDWMELEQKRGISVTSSVMQFQYLDHVVNILDTPGHQDFSEDTYRTLAAADCAVMLIDAAKGVEPQTEKLFRVCKLRGIPIFTFINKMDRVGREPLDLMEELHHHLGIPACPMNWPVFDKYNFRGIYERTGDTVHLFEATAHGSTAIESVAHARASQEVETALGEEGMQRLADDLELLDVAGDSFDAERVARGELTPLYFGSALNNFGVKLFFESFLQIAPAPLPHESSAGVVLPTNPEFSGFVFKIQANMNSAHRDRVAFLRVCSGRFVRGMEVFHPRPGRTIRLNNPASFMARERTIIEEAWPGDIVGLFDPGIFRVGDTLTSGKSIHYGGIPHFSPELFRKVRVRDALQRKSLDKGLEQLAEEGAIQVFADWDTETRDILGAVGTLQFDVLAFRLESEYNVKAVLEPLPYTQCRWVVGAPFDAKTFKRSSGTLCARDRDGHPVILFNSGWAVGWAEEQNKDHKLLPVSPTVEFAGSLRR